MVVKGFTISGGNGEGSPNPTINGAQMQAGRAGAIAVQGATTVTFEDCLIANNSATESGAVEVFANQTENGSTTFRRCTFKSNTTEKNAGAIGSQKSNLFIYDCTFEDNYAKSNGGAIFVNGHWSQTSGVQSWCHIYNTTFTNNSCGAVGSAVYGIWGDHFTMVNCTVCGNSSTGDGAAVAGHYAEIDICSCTITGNSGKKWGGVVSKTNNATIRICNSIVAGNEGAEGSENLARENDAANEIKFVAGIAGNKLYNLSGVSSDCSFDAKTMLGDLADNGGFTKTMALVGNDNPAVAGGLDASQISEAIKDSIIPEDGRTLASSDQRGVKRTGKHLGACAK